MSLLPESLQRPALSACARHHPMLTESMFDEGVVEGFRRLSEEDAAGVFEELLAADLSNVSMGCDRGHCIVGVACLYYITMSDC